MRALAENLARKANRLREAADYYARVGGDANYREVYEAEVAVECAARALRRAANEALSLEPPTPNLNHGEDQ